MKAVAAVLALTLSFAPLARADEPTPVSVSAGEALNVCQAGLVHCPVSSFRCDDPKVAIVENGPDGAVLRGVSPGTTLCSLLGFALTLRRVIRVTVSKGEPAQKP